MAEQLNLISSGQVIPTALHTEMQRSYLEYAMSVIVGRALPDVRDGLKPVHRRIIYAMHELGLTPDRPFRKCARVVGDVLGKYHPHGDQSVYDALVRLVQDFSSRYPLLAGHGNFGSVDDDPPAAMRYTETRLASIAQEALLAEIGDATVGFTDNFDNSQQEPVVLPAQLPILLLNGSSGIAVGMATNIPPHNLGELIDGLIALIDRPHLTDQELLTIIPGPDFPTGGEIVYSNGIRDAYLTGRGSITVRGIVQVEEFQPARGRHRRNALIVTELPFQVNKAAWIEKIADLVNNGKIEGISDLRDESDREGMRVVIELKRDANTDHVLRELYRQTPLQNNFGVILLALRNGQPQQLSLRQLLEEFLIFREETLTRRYSHDLEQVNQRSHILAGLLQALENLDLLINILRQAPDGSTAKVQIQEQLDLSHSQADAILAMPLRRITGLERQNLQNEFDELAQKRAQLERLLGDRRELLKALKKDLRSLKRQFSDPRRTRISGEIPPWPSTSPKPPAATVPKAVATPDWLKPAGQATTKPLGIGAGAEPPEPPASGTAPEPDVQSELAEPLESPGSLEVPETQDVPGTLDMLPDLDSPASLSLENPIETSTETSTGTSTGTSAEISAEISLTRGSKASGAKLAKISHKSPKIPVSEAPIEPLLLEITPSEPEPTVLHLTQRGFLQRFRSTTVDQSCTPSLETEAASIQESSFEPSSEAITETLDPLQHVWMTQTDHRLLLLTREGKAYTQSIHIIPTVEQTPKQQGVAAVRLLPASAHAHPAAIARILELPPLESPSPAKPPVASGSRSLLLISQRGRIKRVPLTEFADCGNRGLMTFRFKEADLLCDAQWIQTGQDVLFANQTGRVIRFKVTESDLPLMNRNHQGLPVMRLGRQEVMVGCAILDGIDEVLLISQRGYYQRIPVATVRRSLRGDLGLPSFRFVQRADQLIAILPLHRSATLYLHLETSDDPESRLIPCNLDHFLPILPGEICQPILTSQGLPLIPPESEDIVVRATVSLTETSHC